MLDTTAGKISAFIAHRFPKATITDADDIFSLGFINSLFAMELVMFLEKEFGITLPNNELVIDNFRTVTRMAELVGRLRPEPAAV
ncbi:acyl carrier protein [Actinospica durhamensis]|uniref:Acyl carrier protein n=1 Tax=Actinospica durhamensis TaxID=1508375 RepID=A0A941EN98_9ACTN|nr:acyl carrier protein [Actinospica durhamensis]MBR7833508.1 acyl carrier protein [Actinospica durhamensis]